MSSHVLTFNKKSDIRNKMKTLKNMWQYFNIKQRKSWYSIPGGRILQSGGFYGTSSPSPACCRRKTSNWRCSEESDQPAVLGRHRTVPEVFHRQMLRHVTRLTNHCSSYLVYKDTAERNASSWKLKRANLFGIIGPEREENPARQSGLKCRVIQYFCPITQTIFNHLYFTSSRN